MRDLELELITLCFIKILVYIWVSVLMIIR
jgi:hypothetical protein